MKAALVNFRGKNERSKGNDDLEGKNRETRLFRVMAIATGQKEVRKHKNSSILEPVA